MSNCLNSKVKARELFESEIQAARERPGPGNYEERLFRSGSCAGTSLKSKNNRFINFENEVPGVGAYEW